MTTLMVDTKVRKRLLAIPEAAEYLSVSERAMRQLVWEGKVPQVRINRRVLLDIRDLDRFIETVKGNALWDRN